MRFLLWGFTRNMPNTKQGDENYDSAADSEIDLDQEKAEPASKV